MSVSLHEAMRRVEAGRLSMSAAAKLLGKSSRQSLGATFWSLHLRQLKERRANRSKR